MTDYITTGLCSASKAIPDMYAQYRKNRRQLCLGPRSDSTHHREWTYLRLLYPTMTLCSEFSPPPRVQEAPEDINVQQQQRSPTPIEGFISDLSFSEDGRSLLATSSDGRAFLFDPNVQRRVGVVEVSDDPALRVLHVPDGRGFVTASADNCIRLWDARRMEKPVNTLRGHSNLIRSLHYNRESSWLISSSYDCNVRYWHLPSYQIPRSNEEEREGDSDEADYRGILFSCPDLNQLAVSWECRKLLCINSKGVVFSISNLDLEHLKEDVKFAQFNDTLPLLLSWILPNTSTDRRNAIRMIDGNEYNPSSQYTLSKVHHLETHPHLPVMLIRFSSTYKTLFSNKARDLTTIYKLNRALTVGDLAMFDTVKAYGTDVMEESLLFTSEQVRYSTMFEKRPCFSTCGRVVASPEKNCVRLLGFSEALDTPLHASTNGKGGPSASSSSSSSPFEDGLLPSSVWWLQEPNQMLTVATIPREVDSAMCAKFSGNGGPLLAVGETMGKVSLHQPKL